MKIFFYILLYSYSLLMGITPFVMLKERAFPYWLIVINVIGASLLIFTPKSSYFLIFGLLVLLVAAILNGFIINGLPNYKHVLVRLLFSLFLYLMATKLSLSS